MNRKTHMDTGFTRVCDGRPKPVCNKMGEASLTRDLSEVTCRDCASAFLTAMEKGQLSRDWLLETMTNEDHLRGLFRVN